MKTWVKARALGWSAAALVAATVIIGAVGTAARYDLVQLLTILPAAVLAWSSAARDTDTEREATRNVGALDATWWAGAALLCAAGTWLILRLTSGSGVMDFLTWSILFTVGTTAVASRWLRLPEALGVTTLLLFASYVARYVLGPTWALIHQESPASFAWATSVIALVLGVAALFTRPSKRSA